MLAAVARLTPSSVLAVRAVVLWVLRGVSVWLVAWGVFQVGARVVFGAMSRGPTGAWQVWSDIGQEHGIVRGVPLVVVGVVLGASSRRLARWIVRPAEVGCPACGYASPGPGGRCPECGLPGLDAAEQG